MISFKSENSCNGISLESGWNKQRYQGKIYILYCKFYPRTFLLASIFVNISQSSVKVEFLIQARIRLDVNSIQRAEIMLCRSIWFKPVGGAVQLCLSYWSGCLLWERRSSRRWHLQTQWGDQAPTCQGCFQTLPETPEPVEQQSKKQPNPDFII